MIILRRNKPFKLPRLGSNTFARLMKAKLKYDKTKGMFEITDNSELNAIISILRESLNNEDIILELECAICHESANCHECEYADICNRINVSNLCICKSCLEKSDAYALYKDTFKQRLKFNTNDK